MYRPDIKIKNHKTNRLTHKFRDRARSYHDSCMTFIAQELVKQRNLSQSLLTGQLCLAHYSIQESSDNFVHRSVTLTFPDIFNQSQQCHQPVSVIILFIFCIFHRVP